MDKIINTLGKYGDQPVKIRDLPFTKAKTKPLVELGLAEYVKLPLKTGKPPKNPNAIRLTPTGLLLYKLKSSGNEFSLMTGLMEIKNNVSNFQKKVEQMLSELDFLKQEIVKINQQLDVMKTKISKQPQTVNEKEFWEYLIKAYNKYKGKVSAVASLGDVVNELELELGLDRKTIEKVLLSLYSSKKISLEPGQGGNYFLVDDDGTKYSFLRIEQ